jgi:hypothetical protein
MNNCKCHFAASIYLLLHTISCHYILFLAIKKYFNVIGRGGGGGVKEGSRPTFS